MPVLKQGSSGPDVTSLQQKLKYLGFDPNGVDGHFGAGTRDAVIAFQQSKGLQADGIAGPATLAASQVEGSGADTNDGAGGGVTTDSTVGAVTTAPGDDGGNAGPQSPATSTTGGALNLAGLTGHLPALVIAQIPETAAEFGITTNLRLAHFLAQCALESTGFTATVENLNYRAARLMQVFPKYFRNVDPAAYANNPTKIANRAYADRMGNGDETSGDGFKFRGRGYIQLTGKNNYAKFSEFVGEDCVADPDLVATKYPLASAAFYFSANHIWGICDRGANDATVTQVSTAVNGSPPHAVPERLQNFKVFMRALS
ncbi:MAG TPA: peptidoglycan-binding protein [Pyrinomonadaceae bacterium]|nr:peptidoglycan-binding protein [Pyrinomonadaceae bacterium]